jgi:apolipoprotein N-acyltransferase
MIKTTDLNIWINHWTQSIVFLFTNMGENKMKRNRTNGFGLDLIWLALGCAAYALIGWRWSAPVAAWIAPVFLLRFFRNQEKWYVPLVALPCLYAAFLTNMIGAWDLPLIAQIVLPAIVPLPLLLVLYVDRALAPGLTGLGSTLVFPAATVAMDYLVGFTPLGTLFSFASTQFAFTTIIQTASITGIWGISFLIAWFASVVNNAWENGFDLRPGGLRPGSSRPGGRLARLASSPAVLFTAVALLVLTYGSVRIATSASGTSSPSRPQTVRVAGITVEHPRNYWALLDLGTPREEVARYRQEMHRIEDRLFEQSSRAVQAGARIVFWAEGNGVVPEEDLERFISRSMDFAKTNDIYFAPGILELRYGTSMNYNEVLMFTPQGQLAFTYQKTKSWLPVDSDGQIKTVETPYGTLAAAICFDLDFPAFLRQAARAGTDIMLVPGYDSERIRPFHTEPALIRGVEGGYSVIRQVNEGTSMAADSRANVLARQDYFMTADRLMLADVPTRGNRTLYRYLGDWFAWASAALLVLLAGLAVFRGSRNRHAAAS